MDRKEFSQMGMETKMDFPKLCSGKKMHPIHTVSSRLGKMPLVSTGRLRKMPHISIFHCFILMHLHLAFPFVSGAKLSVPNIGGNFKSVTEKNKLPHNNVAPDLSPRYNRSPRVLNARARADTQSSKADSKGGENEENLNVSSSSLTSINSNSQSGGRRGSGEARRGSREEAVSKKQNPQQQNPQHQNPQIFIRRPDKRHGTYGSSTTTTPNNNGRITNLNTNLNLNEAALNALTASLAGQGPLGQQGSLGESSLRQQGASPYSDMISLRGIDLASSIRGSGGTPAGSAMRGTPSRTPSPYGDIITMGDVGTYGDRYGKYDSGIGYGGIGYGSEMDLDLQLPPFMSAFLKEKASKEREQAKLREKIFTRCFPKRERLDSEQLTSLCVRLTDAVITARGELMEVMDGKMDGANKGMMGDNDIYGITV